MPLLYPIGCIPPEVTRYERLEFLKQYYLRILFEDPHEGSMFDCDVLDAINALQEKYPRGR